MSGSADSREGAVAAWRNWCQTLEEKGVAALQNLASEDEVDLAEGLRHLGRLSWVHLLGSVENKNPRDPYFWETLDPHLKMGGDNPQGLYLSAPINGTDTFRITGMPGSPAWLSVILRRSLAGRQAGRDPFGNAAFSPQMTYEADGSFELYIGPEPRGNNWIGSDEYSDAVLIRQFFGTPGETLPAKLKIENLSAPDHRPSPLNVETMIAQLTRASATFASLLPSMQNELAKKQPNAFATDIGDPTSKSGGVPGGNAVTARWELEPGQALLVEFAPPTPCAYWDVQVGNLWYESWDYRNFLSGLTYRQAHPNADGSITLVVSDRDPGVANWLETAYHRRGHIAIRWQLSEGHLPIPRCSVIDVADAAEKTGLPAVGPEQRHQQRRDLRTSFERRFTD